MTSALQTPPTRSDPRLTPATAVMTTSPVTIDLDADLWSALRTLLSTGLRHLVVEDADGRCRGILSDRYVVAEWPGDAIGARSTRVRQMLGDPAPHLSPTATVAEAARVMLGAGTDALVVVDAAGRTLGILTGSDLIRALATPDALGD